MGFRYESLEDGQVITTDEPREDLDALARWKRSDAEPEAATPTNIGPSNPDPVAGPVNTSPVTGGQPPLTSTTAGFSNPADIISTEEAARRAADIAAQSNADASKAADAAESEQESGDTGSGAQTGGSEDQEPERPGLNGSTEEWLAFAKHPAVALDVADDAGRGAIVAAYIEKFAPAGNASGADWAAYAEKHGVQVEEKDGRDKIRAAVIDAGWAAKA